MRLVTLLICLSKTGIQSSGPKSIEIYKKKVFSQYCESFPDIGCGCILVSVCMSGFVDNNPDLIR